MKECALLSLALALVVSGCGKKDTPSEENVIRQRGIIRTEMENYLASRVAYQITTDKEGNLKTIPMPEFEFKDHFLEDQESLPEELKKIKLKSPNDKLEPVQV